MELDELAELLGLDRTEVYRLIRSGELRGIKTGVGHWYVERSDALRYKSNS